MSTTKFRFYLSKVLFRYPTSPLNTLLQCSAWIGDVCTLDKHPLYKYTIFWGCQNVDSSLFIAISLWENKRGKQVVILADTAIKWNRMSCLGTPENVTVHEALAIVEHHSNNTVSIGKYQRSPYMWSQIIHPNRLLKRRSPQWWPRQQRRLFFWPREKVLEPLSPLIRLLLTYNLGNKTLSTGSRGKSSQQGHSK